MIPADWLPADWRIDRWTDAAGILHTIVFRPDSSAGMSFDEALVLRDLLTTSSRPELKRAVTRA